MCGEGSGGFPDLHAAAQHANADAQGEDGGMFNQALGFLHAKKDDNEDVDEEGAQRAHQQAYG
jgi:hypothetical protein